jgi:release factor glutamine methyltransferase
LAQLAHEPIKALVAHEGGLSDLIEICTQARHHLHYGAWLLLEHAYDQGQRVREMLQNLGYTQVQSRCDLAGIERCTGAQWLKMK